jgi:hypothetical protein
LPEMAAEKNITVSMSVTSCCYVSDISKRLRGWLDRVYMLDRIYMLNSWP